MRSATPALCGLLPAACLYLNPSFDPPADGASDTSAAASTVDGATTSTTGGTAPTTAAPTSTDASTGSQASTGATTSGADLGAPQYPHYPVTSCQELRAQFELSGELVVTGYYTLDDIGAPGGELDVYCDMDIAGGGWTLVGRSAGVDQLSSFGWQSGRGVVGDDSRPYSLDLAAHPIAFTEILVGDCPAGKSWGTHAYRFTTGPDFVNSFPDTTKLLGPPDVVLGGCMPGDEWMMKHAGETALDQAFFFRDFDFFDGAYYGLLANGFYLHTYEGCVPTGDLDGRHGMLMIR